MTTKVDAVRSLFDQPDWYFSRRGYDVRIRMETVQSFVRLPAGSHVLDIGCGDGSISMPLVSEKTRLTLLDVSSGMLSIAKSKVPAALKQNVTTINQDFMKAEFEPGSFDLILCIGLLVHVVDPAAFISKVVSLLKPDGKIIMECSDASHFLSSMFSALYRLKGLFRHSTYKLNTVAYSDVVRMLEQHNLYAENTFRYSTPAPIINRAFSQQGLYNLNRFVFGSAEKNRNSWLGNEYLTLFSHKSR